MYIGYTIENYDGNDVVNFVGIFSNRDDVEKYQKESTEVINFEECELIDMNNFHEIRYIDILYFSKNINEWEVRYTNTFETRNRKDINKVVIYNDKIRIKKVIKAGDDATLIAQKLMSMCPHLVFKKEMGELINYEETKIKMDGIYVEIDIDDFLESMNYS